MLEGNSRQFLQERDANGPCRRKKSETPQAFDRRRTPRINPRGGPRLLPREGLYRDHHQRHPRGVGRDHRLDLPLLRRQGRAGHGAARRRHGRLVGRIAGLVRNRRRGGQGQRRRPRQLGPQKSRAVPLHGRNPHPLGHRAGIRGDRRYPCRRPGFAVRELREIRQVPQGQGSALAGRPFADPRARLQLPAPCRHGPRSCRRQARRRAVADAAWAAVKA